MPVCVCIKRGQVRRDDGLIRFYEEGEKDNFKECPVLFTPLSVIMAQALDFNRVSEDLLRDKEIIELSRLVDFYKERYGEDLTGETRDRVVDKIMYARHNPMTAISERGIAPLSHEFKGTQDTTSPLGLGDLTVEMTSDVDVIPPPPPVDDIDNSLDDLLSDGDK